MLKNAIQHVIDDSSFHLKVEPGATALLQAKYVAEWSGKDENRHIFKAFEERLVKEGAKGLFATSCYKFECQIFCE